MTAEEEKERGANRGWVSEARQVRKAQGQQQQQLRETDFYPPACRLLPRREEDEGGGEPGFCLQLGGETDKGLCLLGSCAQK